MRGPIPPFADEDLLDRLVGCPAFEGDRSITTALDFLARTETGPAAGPRAVDGSTGFDVAVAAALDPDPGEEP